MISKIEDGLRTLLLLSRLVRVAQCAFFDSIGQSHVRGCGSRGIFVLHRKPFGPMPARYVSMLTLGGVQQNFGADVNVFMYVLVQFSCRTSPLTLNVMLQRPFANRPAGCSASRDLGHGTSTVVTYTHSPLIDRAAELYVWSDRNLPAQRLRGSEVEDDCSIMTMDIQCTRSPMYRCIIRHDMDESHARTITTLIMQTSMGHHPYKVHSSSEAFTSFHT